MTIRIIIGKTEGFISSVGFIVDGKPFLYRGKEMHGLHWESREELDNAITSLRDMAAQLQAIGWTIEGLEQLDEIERRR